MQHFSQALRWNARRGITQGLRFSAAEERVEGGVSEPLRGTARLTISRMLAKKNCRNRYVDDGRKNWQLSQLRGGLQDIGWRYGKGWEETRSVDFLLRGVEIGSPLRSPGTGKERRASCFPWCQLTTLGCLPGPRLASMGKVPQLWHPPNLDRTLSLTSTIL